jgi:hypothetical protein
LIESASEEGEKRRISKREAEKHEVPKAVLVEAGPAREGGKGGGHTAELSIQMLLQLLHLRLALVLFLFERFNFCSVFRQRRLDVFEDFGGREVEEGRVEFVAVRREEGENGGEEKRLANIRREQPVEV